MTKFGIYSSLMVLVVGFGLALPVEATDPCVKAVNQELGQRIRQRWRIPLIRSHILFVISRRNQNLMSSNAGRIYFEQRLEPFIENRNQRARLAEQGMNAVELLREGNCANYEQ